MKINAEHYKLKNQTETLGSFTKYDIFNPPPPPETLKYYSMMLKHFHFSFLPPGSHIMWIQLQSIIFSRSAFLMIVHVLVGQSAYLRYYD